MSTTVLDRPAAMSPTSATRPSAVVWINGRHATVARMDSAGTVSSCSIERGIDSNASFHALVVHAIGDRERVVILGPTSARLELERAYVALYHRPDRLVDVEPAGPVSEIELIARLRQLAA